MLGKLLRPDIQDLLQNKRLRDLQEALVEFPAVDIADLIADLSEEEQAVVFRLLPRHLAADVFENLTVDDQELLLESFNQEQSRRIIQEMDPDDRTALLEELPADVTRKLLRLLSPEERQIAQELLAYPEDSVGRLMTPDYIDLRSDMTAREAIDYIRRVGMDKETVYACYVTSEDHVLQGTVGLRRLVLASEDKRVGDLMQSPPLAVANTHDDQEKAARKLQDYDLLALPVVDDENRLVGIVTVDDVIDVLTEEADADMQFMAGVVPSTEVGYLKQRLLSLSWRRGLPLVGLVIGEFLAAMVLRSFHEALQIVLPLAFFIPMVMATGGGTGLQTCTLVVRGLSTGDIAPGDLGRLLAREMILVLIMGCVLGFLAVGFGFLLLSQDVGFGHTSPFRLGATVGCSLIMVMLLSVAAGTLLPLLLRSLKQDPAMMSSPLLSTLVDVLGLAIYFLIAGWMLRL